jgi:hypothetical protein
MNNSRELCKDFCLCPRAQWQPRAHKHLAHRPQGPLLALLLDDTHAERARRLAAVPLTGDARGWHERAPIARRPTVPGSKAARVYTEAEAVLLYLTEFGRAAEAGLRRLASRGRRRAPSMRTDALGAVADAGAA